ncbi:GumC family protein [Sphingomonas faeni]|uniref:GumC family protein n=1 Tax=Sphingomonas faeni TaxID=185950 RepID=UPI00335035DC
MRDLLNSAFYHRRVVAIVFCTIIALGVIAAILLPPTYRAEARLLPLSAGIYDMQSANSAPSPNQALDPLEVVNVEMQLLASMEIHRSLVRKALGPGATTAEVNAELNALEANLHVTKATDANVIELSYTARDPAKAADMLRRLLAEYFEARANVLTSGRVAFLVGQRDKVKAQLDAANAGIVVYQQQNNVVDIAAQIAGAVQQDDLLRQHKLDAEASLADGRQSVATLQSGARSVPAQVELYSDNAESARTIGEMQAQVLQLQSRRADLASRYMAGAPLVVQVDKQIAGLQSAIARQKGNLVATRRTGRNQYYDSSQDRLTQAKATIAGEAARSTALNAQIGASRTRLNQLIAIQDTISRLRLDRDVLADTFRTLSTQVEQARVQLNQTTSAGSPNVRIIEAPTTPSKRSNPPMLLVAGSIVAAIMIAGAVLLVLTSLRDTFLAPQEVERVLGLPVLYAPFQRRDGAIGAGRRDFGRLIAAIDGHGPHSARTVLLLAPNSRRSLQEAALGLGAALNRRTPGRVMLVRFADGAPVPSTGSEMQIDMVEGMATGVIGTAACSNRRLDAKLLADLASHFDYVIVTAPPTATSFESIELSTAVDAVVLVLDAEGTRRPVARDLVLQTTNAGSGILGVMLLGRRQHIPQLLYRLLIERRSPTP